MNAHCFKLTPQETAAVTAGLTITVYQPIAEAWDKCGDIAGAIHPASLSGWIAWFPGNDPHGTLAEFTKQQYSEGFPSPYQVGDEIYTKVMPLLRHKIQVKSVDAIRAVLPEGENPWMWAIGISKE